MKTITQYREEVKSLMKKIGDIDAKATTENRDLASDEIKLKEDIMDEVDHLRSLISNMERTERISAELKAPVSEPQTRPRPQEQRKEERSQDQFRSLGEQMVAVVRAGRPGGPVDPRLFNVRTAASGLNETVPSEGGFLVQQDFVADLLQDTFETGLLARRCRQQPISGTSNSIKINGVDETSRASTRYGGIVGYWEEEAALKQGSMPKFRKIELNLKKLIGLCYATDELLDDAAALEGFIRSAFPGEFGFLTDDAIINGTGAGQPLGILNSGSLVSVAKQTGQAAATVVYENVLKMYSRMFASSLNRAEWFINQSVWVQLAQMSLAVGTGGVPVFMPANGAAGQPYATLFGRPIVPLEQCAALGTVGDIIFGDFGGGYILATKGGIKADMSIHIRFLYDESVFRFVLRIDGQPVRASALTPYKGSDTLGHFIVLATRA